MSVRRFLLLLSALASSGCCCSGLLFDDSRLESAARDVESFEAGGVPFEVRATLDGHFVREHHGGGRLGYTNPTSEQVWLMRVQATRADEGPFQLLVPVGRTAEGWVAWRGDDRDDGAGALDGLTLERCATDDGGAVLRVVHEGEPWLVARAGEGWAFVAPFESDASSCEQAREDAPPAAVHLRSVWEDGLRATLELAEQRETRPGSGISAEGRARTKAAIRACAVLLDRGEPEEALQCFWGSRVWANASMGAIRQRVIDGIQAGADAVPDLEAAMFDLLAPGGRSPHPDPALEALIAEHTATVVGGYLAQARTPDRMQTFVEATEARCGEEPCEQWRTDAAQRLRERLESLE